MLKSQAWISSGNQIFKATIQLSPYFIIGSIIALKTLNQQFGQLNAVVRRERKCFFSNGKIVRSHATRIPLRLCRRKQFSNSVLAAEALRV